MDAFNVIYMEAGWGYCDNETLSGGGSTKSINFFRNKFLANFINENNILDIFEICGDCNWQHEFMKLIKNKEAKYFGFDVSNYALNLAKEKNKSHVSMNFSEIPINLCETVLHGNNGEKSLIIIKEVIQHLPIEFGLKILKNQE